MQQPEAVLEPVNRMNRKLGSNMGGTELAAGSYSKSVHYKSDVPLSKQRYAVGAPSQRYAVGTPSAGRQSRFSLRTENK